MKLHQERVIIEKKELDAKLKKLAAFIVTETFRKLSRDEQLQLNRQACIMTDYSEVLGERIAAFPKE